MDFMHGSKSKAVLEASNDRVPRPQGGTEHIFIISHYQMEDHVHLREVGVSRHIEVTFKNEGGR